MKKVFKFIESLEDYTNDTLLIVDVQKSFKKYYTPYFLNELMKYCKKFKNVYQVWDNHIDGDTNKDYLYSKKPDIPVNGDTYTFPNQKDMIEKRYTYNVDINFFKNLLDAETLKEINYKEKNNLLKEGDFFKTNENTYIFYIGNDHVWFHCPLKLHQLFEKYKGKMIVIVGGSEPQCLRDVEVTAKSLGVIVKINYKFTYNSNGSKI